MATATSDPLGAFAARLNSFSLNTLLKNSDLTPSTQHHLVRVYVTLACALLSAAAGATFGQYVYSMGVLLPSLAFIGMSAWLQATPFTPATDAKRAKLLAGAAFANGLSLSPLIGMAISVNAGLLTTALVGTSLVFACFSLSALLARRRSYLYLSGVLSSALSAMMWWRLSMSLFGRGMAGFEVELWVGLAVFVGYVLVDTQVIVEKASLGDRDVTGHALALFLDFSALFVRILVLLMKNQQRKEQRRSDSRRRGDRRD